MKTHDEVNTLKHAWRFDPCWDIERTEGFEEYRTELLNYRLEWESRWQRETEEKQLAFATVLGVPGNVRLAGYLESLEGKLNSMNGFIKMLQYEISELRARIARGE